MREGWQETSLGDVAELNSENTKGWPDAKQIRYIDLSSVTAERGIDRNGLESLSYGTSPGRARRVVRTGDVLVATVRPYLRGFAWVDSFLDGEVASTGFAVLRADSERCLPGYVWAVTQTETFVNFLISRSTGSSYPAVRADDVAAYLFHLPSLAEQCRIVDFLESVDSYIGALRAQADAARTARVSLLHELLNAGGDDWVETTLAELVRHSIGGVWGTEPGSGEIDVPVYRQTEFNNDGWLQLPADATRSISSKQLASRRLEPDDVLVQKSAGTPKLPGRVVRVPNSIGEAIFSNFLQLLRSDTRVCLPEYLFWLLWSLHNQGMAFKHQRGTNIRNLDLKGYLATVVTQPPLDEQRRIVDLIESADEVISAADKATADSVTLRASLLSDLLSRDHEIPESYDALLKAP